MTEKTTNRTTRNETALDATAIVVPLLLLLSGAIALSIDVPVAAYFKHGRYPRLLAELFENVEPFGHAVGASLVIISVVVLDPARRAAIGWLIAGSLGSGTLASLGKLFLARSRPRSFNLLQGTVWDTFGTWFPREHSGGIQSFPSAHTATAVGLALMLATWYPRGRWFFAALAALVGMHRIQSSAHFLSDVCAGAALGWLVASACLAASSRQRAVSQKSKSLDIFKDSASAA